MLGAAISFRPAKSFSHSESAQLDGPLRRNSLKHLFNQLTVILQKSMTNKANVG
jgi:hypothetical protein